MGARIRNFDWARTPLGAIEAWPQAMRTAVSICLNSRFPMVLWLGPELTMLYNDAWRPVLGATKHPHGLGRPGREVWPEIWDIIGAQMRSVVETGTATWSDDLLLTVDRYNYAEEAYFTYSYSPIQGENGDVCGVFSAVSETTLRVIGERRLKTLSELGALIKAKTSEEALTLSAEVLRANDADVPFALIYLFSEDGGTAELAQAIRVEPGKTCSPLTVDLSREHLWPLAEVAKTQTTAVVDDLQRRFEKLPGGRWPALPKSALVMPLQSPGKTELAGILIGGISPYRQLDDDYRRFYELVAGHIATSVANARAYQEAQKRAEMLAEIDRAKTVFFSNVSHEFRTPLTLMLGPLENLLRKQEIPPEDHEEVATAHRNSLRLLKLVNSLLDFSRLEGGRLKAAFTATDLCALTTELASNFRSAMEAAGLTFVVDCEPLYQPVYVDHEMWEKIVLNLLSNAFKFTFQGQVTIWLGVEGGAAVLSVSDTGIGIPDVELPRIFERFHRVEGARGRTYEGTGIGLALIQEYVKLHGGVIAVSSRLGEGSTFTVRLPFGTAHLPPDRIKNAVETRSPAPGAAAFIDEVIAWLPQNAKTSVASSPAPGQAYRPRIVLADDNADMREHVGRTLGEEYEILTANDGKEALELIRQNPPDLLLTDVMMPGCDGFDLLRAVRKDDRIHTLPVIFLSARAGEEMRVEGIEAGADDYLVKPFTANELRARVRTHIQMGIARRRATEREAALRAEAEAARDRAISILESITDGFIALDRDWRITYVNAEAERLNGMRRAEMLGKNHWEIFPATVGSAIHTELLRAAERRIAVDFENYYTPWRRWFHVKAYPAENGGLSVFFEDITARKSAEERLRQSEERFREMIDALPAAIYTTDAQGRLTHFNPAAVRLSGRVPELGTDKWCVTWRLFWPDGTPLPHDQCPMAVALKGGSVRPGLECVAERPDGSRFWFTPYPTPLRDGDGRITGGINMLVDITARKEAEEALRESEERFRNVFESSAVGVAILTLDARFLQANEAFCQILGYSEEELQALDCASLTHPKDVPKMQELINELVAGETPKFVLVKRYFTKDGRTIWVNNSVSAMLDRHGRPECLIVLCEDVTTRKEAEMAIRAAEERFRAIVETTPECVKVVANDGTLLHMNSAGLQMVGAGGASEVIGKNVYDLIVPECRDDFRAFNERICSGEKGSLEFEITGLKGTRRQMETHAAPLHNSDGTVVQLAITRDVTEQRRRERAALLLSAIVDSSDDAIISKDLNGVVTSWNKSAERLFGYSAAEAVGKSIAELLIPADRQEEEPKILERLRRGERIDHFETVRRCKDGSLLDISLTISPVKDSAGRIIGASKIARDITDRKRIESAVQSLNAQLTADLSAVTRMQQLSTRLVQADDFPQLLGEIMDAGIEITNADMGNIQLLEGGVLKIVSQRGFKEPFLDFFNQVHDGQAACGSALQNRERVIVQDVSQSPVFADSHMRDVMLAAGVLAVQSTPLISRSGQLLGMFSTHFRSPHIPTERELRLLDVLARQAADLIERKRAEAALIASEVKFRQLAEAGPQIIWLSGPRGDLEFVNQRWVEFSGLDYEATRDPEQLAQRLHPEDHLLDHWGKSVATGTPFELEARLRGKDGEFRWFMMRSVPVRDEGGEIVRWVGTSTDIHHNMVLQLELKRANHDLEQFAYSASHDLQEPLRSIKIYGELLVGRHGSKLTGEAREFLEFLHAGASRMEMLVRDLLAYTQVTKLEAPSEPIEAGDVLASTLESLSQTIIESGASVTYDSLPAVRIHATHLRQLFQNLIGNAIKYRSPDRAPAIHVSAERKNGSWAFSVRDNGIGIEPEYYKFIFGLFKRLHTEDEYSGTGLGLAICQRIVERYHGRIWVESEPGQGSTFRFEVPSNGNVTMSWLEPLAEEVNR
jgi:PAS domain S-box-containing protein